MLVSLTENSVSGETFLANCAGLPADWCGCVCLAESCFLSRLDVAGTLCSGCSHGFSLVDALLSGIFVVTPDKVRGVVELDGTCAIICLLCLALLFFPFNGSIDSVIVNSGSNPGYSCLQCTQFQTSTF